MEFFKNKGILPLLTKNDFLRFSIKAAGGIFSGLFSIVRFFLYFIIINKVILSQLREYMLLNNAYNNQKLKLSKQVYYFPVAE